MTPEQRKYNKDFKTLRTLLLGAGYNNAVKALEFGEKYHPGFRKDGKTPSFHHQVEIAFSLFDDRVRLKEGRLDPDIVIAAGLLHDTPEDNPELQLEEIRKAVAPEVVRIIMLLNKMRNGKKLDTDVYYRELLACPEAIIVKLHDRRSNVRTMLAMKPEKLAAYIVESRQLLKIAKEAITRYPELQGLLHQSRRQIKGMLDIYLGFARKTETGEAPEIVAAFRQANLLPSAPRPS